MGTDEKVLIKQSKKVLKAELTPQRKLHVLKTYAAWRIISKRIPLIKLGE